MRHTMTSTLIDRWHSQWEQSIIFLKHTTCLACRNYMLGEAYVSSTREIYKKKSPYLGNVHGRSIACQWRCHFEHLLLWCQGTRSV